MAKKPKVGQFKLFEKLRKQLEKEGLKYISTEEEFDEVLKHKEYRREIYFLGGETQSLVTIWIITKNGSPVQVVEITSGNKYQVRYQKQQKENSVDDNGYKSYDENELEELFNQLSYYFENYKRKSNKTFQEIKSPKTKNISNKQDISKSWHDFLEWYQHDKDTLLEWAKKEVEGLEKRRQRFLKEWPLENLSALSFSQLATNLPNSLTEEEKNNNLFTQLSKNGKYDFLMSLGQSRTTSKIKYVDGIEKVNFNSNKTDDFTEHFNFSEITQQFQQKIRDLLALTFESDGFFNTNEYSALLIKLVCLYSEKNDIFIPDNNISKGDKKAFFNPIISNFSQNRYEINHQILSEVLKQVPELSNSWILNILLYKFGEEVDGTPWGKPNDDENNATEDEGEKLVKPKKVFNTINTILYGPPGTGKTYNSVIYAVNTIDKAIAARFEDKEVTYDDYLETYLPKYKELEKEGQIAFTTFHQSYGYEEFIEGIKPISDGDLLTYPIQPGVFKQFCKKALDSKVKQEIDNFDETWSSFESDFQGEGDFILSFPRSEKFVRLTKTGLEFLTSEGNNTHDFVNKEDIYSLYRYGKITKNKSRLKLMERVISLLHDNYGLKEYIPSNNSDKNYVFIIDEINRGNISKIFGELITLIEDSKREGAKEAMSVTLPYSGETFSVPNNVYILGTMNTADRSIALMDTALRRRFEFVEMMPDTSTLAGVTIEGIKIDKMLETMNKRIELLYDREHTLGHAFFMGLTNDSSIDDLAKIFQNKIIPLLQEYFYEDYEKIMLVLGIDPSNNTDKDFISKKEDKEVFKFVALGEYDIQPIYQINVNAFNQVENYEAIYVGQPEVTNGGDDAARKE